MENKNKQKELTYDQMKMAARSMSHNNLKDVQTLDEFVNEQLIKNIMIKYS